MNPKAKISLNSLANNGKYVFRLSAESAENIEIIEGRFIKYTLIKENNGEYISHGMRLMNIDVVFDIEDI